MNYFFWGMLIVFAPLWVILIGIPIYCLIGALCWMWGYILDFIGFDFLLNFAKKYYYWMDGSR